MVGKISKAFQLVVIEKASIEKVLPKSLQEVVELKGQFQHLQATNWHNFLTIQHLQIELLDLEGTKMKVQKLEIENSNY
jgi:hypothetical protein